MPPNEMEFRINQPFTSLDDMFERIHIPLQPGWEKDSRWQEGEGDESESEEEDEKLEREFFGPGEDEEDEDENVESYNFDTIEKQTPPGSPPRPGLVWKPQTHRWIRPGESGVPDQPIHQLDATRKEQQIYPFHEANLNPDLSYSFEAIEESGTFENFNRPIDPLKSGKMRVFHSTTSDRLDSILENGLVPGKEKPPGQDWAPYFKANYFYTTLSSPLDHIGQTEGEMVTLDIDMPFEESNMDAMVPDEDFSQKKEDAIDSFMTGSAGYTEEISPEHIRGVFFYDPDEDDYSYVPNLEFSGDILQKIRKSDTDLSVNSGSEEIDEEKFIIKGKRAYHEHDGFSEHPVRVGDHNAYFASDASSSNGSPKVPDFSESVNEDTIQKAKKRWQDPDFWFEIQDAVEGIFEGEFDKSPEMKYGMELLRGIHQSPEIESPIFRGIAVPSGDIEDMFGEGRDVSFPIGSFSDDVGMARQFAALHGAGQEDRGTVIFRIDKGKALQVKTGRKEDQESEYLTNGNYTVSESSWKGDRFVVNLRQENVF